MMDIHGRERQNQNSQNDDLKCFSISLEDAFELIRLGAELSSKAS